MFRIFHILIILMLHFLILCANASESPLQEYTDNSQTSQIVHRIMNSSAGLMGDDVNKIYKDSNGLMWIGTNYGLSCYYGKSLYNFTYADGNEYNAVNDIVQTADGRLMLATSAGLYTVDVASLSCRPVCKDIEEANSLIVIGNRLFIGTNKGIQECRQDGTVVVTASVENNILSAANNIYDLCLNDSTTFWACNNDGVFLVDVGGKIHKRISLKKYIGIGTCTCIAKVGDMLYIGTSNSGFYRYDMLTEQCSLCTEFPLSVVRDINVSENGNIYISGSVSYKFNPQTNTIAASEGSYTFWHDDEFDIDWKGFFLKGFSHTYHTRRLIEIYRYKSLDTSKLEVRSFCKHGDDLLIGTRNGLYHVNEAQSHIAYFSPEVLGADIVTDINWFAGNFVVTTFENGIYVFNPSHRHSPLRKLSEAIGSFSRIAISTDSLRLFATGSHGFYIFDTGMNIVRHFDHSNSKLPDSYLPEIFIDKYGKGWISTMKGMCIYDPQSETVMSDRFPKNFFNNVGLLSFNQCADGDIFAFVNTIVFKTAPDLSSYHKYDLSAFLDNRGINFIFWHDNRYWVGTTLGLFLFQPDFQSYMLFTESDNLPSLNFNKQQIQLDTDGTLWMGTAKGLIYITPENSTHVCDSVPGHVLIDKVLIDDRRMSAGKILNLSVNPVIDVEWNFGAEKLTVVPFMSDYALHTGIQYEYSFGESYVTLAEMKEIDLKSLPLGNTTFVVRLAGHPETASTYTIRVRPSALFYIETALFLIFSTLLFVLLSLRSRMARYKSALRRKHELECRISADAAVREYKRRLQSEHEQEQEARQKRISVKEAKMLQRQIKEYMDNSSPYRNSEFTLSDLAGAVNSTPTAISITLNLVLGTNFYDFVAQYRLEEFKRRIRSRKYKNYSTITVSEMCGFKRSTFFAAFKKFEGCTPSEWIKRETDKNGQNE